MLCVPEAVSIMRIMLPIFSFFSIHNFTRFYWFFNFFFFFENFQFRRQIWMVRSEVGGRTLIWIYQSLNSTHVARRLLNTLPYKGNQQFVAFNGLKKTDFIDFSNKYRLMFLKFLYACFLTSFSRRFRSRFNRSKRWRKRPKWWSRISGKVIVR